MVDDQTFKFPDTVAVLKSSNGSTVYLVGTAHFSKESQDDVAHVINAVKPDVVVIELCLNRKTILTIDESTIADVTGITLDGLRGSIKKLGLTQGIFYQLMLNISANISRDLGMIPGGEFRRAVQEAKKYNSYIFLGDRPVDVTIKRVISMLSWPKSIKLLSHLLFTSDLKITKEDVEKFKNKDLLETLMLEMAADYPELEKVIVDERDKYLTHSLQSCAGFTIDKTGVHFFDSSPRIVVGVVGLGHIAGIKNYWESVTEEEIAELSIIPPQSKSSKVIKVVLKVGVYGLLIWGISKIPGIKSVSQTAYKAIATKLV
ncbi:traB domain-containing protein [Daktulosphaira vitifoliae]|uniref:traB domain-containing protein n=1 Tax=Daktulosphaira vitifoliae TaxID=58002 RepID=UPI0021A9F6E9|nr:traB domain-containing protein [Daktulosphaira vitifoliae]